MPPDRTGDWWDDRWARWWCWCDAVAAVVVRERGDCGDVPGAAAVPAAAEAPVGDEAEDDVAAAWEEAVAVVVVVVCLLCC